MFDELNFIEKNVELKKITYYKMGGKTKYFATPKTISDVICTINLAKSYQLPIALLGAGSNCVFSDETFEGVVITFTNFKKWCWETDQILFVESGLTNTEVSEICLAKGKDDASWMYRMPGQIGASVRMNARCFGGEMSQIVTEVLTINEHGYVHCYEGKEIFFGYKDTLLMNKPEVVVGIRFHFPTSQTYASILEHMKSCENNRLNKKHFLYPSCGSTFKNNYDYGKPSGQIFEELGLKGEKCGDAEVSQHHANFVWNKKDATTSDMLSLSSRMRSKALAKLSVCLDLEVQPIGEFTKQQFEDCGMDKIGPYTKTNENYFTGLFYYPSKSVEFSFPACIYSSFFTNYFFSKQSKVPAVKVELLQLCSMTEAQRDKNTPFLRWITICDETYSDDFALIPPKSENKKNLWEYSVSELFISHPKLSKYLECEMAPSGQTLMLQFNDIRKKIETIEALKPCKILTLKKNKQEKYEFGLELSYAQLEPFISEHNIKIQCALSLGFETYWLSPYWKCHSEEKKADFHQPDKYLPLRLI